MQSIAKKSCFAGGLQYPIMFASKEYEREAAVISG